MDAVEQIVKEPKSSEAQRRAWRKYQNKCRESPEFRARALEYGREYVSRHREEINARKRQRYYLKKQAAFDNGLKETVVTILYKNKDGPST
jgi:hypothetical protein